MQYTRKELIYMERSIMTEMLAWSRKSKHKPLLITGVRQCGKTYICKEFGRRYFEDTAYFYFEGNHGLQSIFDYDLDPHRILSELGGLIYKKPIVPGKTLVIFDEIQACPRAVTSLKYFCELMPELHIICAGSLLGVSLQRDGISFPVGKVERLVMYPMSFAEFLLACGQEHLLSGADKYLPDKPLAEAYTEPLKKFLKYYYITGGMPEAVATWLETKNFDAVTQIQNNILHDYSADFAKYAPVNDVPKLQLIWQSVPQQLAKENNKFVFSHVKTGKRAADLEDALEWLHSAGLIHRLQLVSNPQLPLAFYAQSTYFKVYLSDVGLLRCQACLSPETILQENQLYNSFKGALTENYVLLELLKQNLEPYFWRSGNTAELDFLIANQETIIPIEAKAEIHTRAKSYQCFCKQYKPEIGFKISMKNIAVNDVVETVTYSLPLYLASFVKKIAFNKN